MLYEITQSSYVLLIGFIYVCLCVCDTASIVLACYDTIISSA